MSKSRIERLLIAAVLADVLKDRSEHVNPYRLAFDVFKNGDKVKCLTSDVPGYTPGNEYEVVEDLERKCALLTRDGKNPLILSIKNGKPTVDCAVARATFEKVENEAVELKIGDYVECTGFEGSRQASFYDLTIGKAYEIKGIDYDGDAYFENDAEEHTYLDGAGLEDGEIVAYYGFEIRVMFKKVDAPAEDEPLIDRLLKDGPHLALVSDISKDRAVKGDVFEVIQAINDDDVGFNYKAKSGLTWKYAIPVDARGNIITEK